jgi:hypothetical protein
MLQASIYKLHASIFRIHAFIVSVHGLPWLHFQPLNLLDFDLNANLDPYPAFYYNADADPNPASKIMQMHAEPDAVPQLGVYDGLI